jgi:YidC/Oxa1 family membrane protein insertase
MTRSPDRRPIDTMEKRTLAAIALSIIVLFAFKYIEDRRMGDAAKRRPLPKPAAVTPAPPAAAAPTAQPSSPVLPEALAVTDTAAPPRKIVVETDLYRAQLDNRGAVLTSWQLQRYKSGRGAIFEMIPPVRAGETGTQPGSLVVDEAPLNAVINGETYAVEVAGKPDAGDVIKAPVTVSLQLHRGTLSVRKTYTFHPASYLVDVGVAVEKEGKALPGRFVLGQDLGPEHEHLLSQSVVLQAVYSQGGKVSREAPPKDENEIKRIGGDIRWVGLDMQYFALISIPKGGIPLFEIQKRPVKTVGLKGEEISRDLLRVTIPESGTWQGALFLGPKEHRILETADGADLSGAIDYGMFSFLVKPLLAALIYMYKYVGNYGVAIILLTLLLTLLLFPFRLKQMLSMKKMAVVQPKIKAIQEKYKKYKKTDPKRAEMNQEVMALYKEHNVNPLGGCLPLLLQMPLLFAFYALLAYSIELRQAPFFAWIHDLSVKDPYYVLPIVMGVTMFISQKMTPMTPGADPTQAKMMMMMPAVFTFMFLNVSSGLNLYFLCSNIFSVVFQKVTERWIGNGGTAVKS